MPYAITMVKKIFDGKDQKISVSRFRFLSFLSFFRIFEFTVVTVWNFLQFVFQRGLQNRIEIEV